MPINAALSASLLASQQLQDRGTAGVITGRTHVRVWAHEIGLYKSGVNLFRADKVHLNDIGLQRYWKSVRGAVEREVTLLNSK